MFEQASELEAKDFLHVVVFDESHKQPEGKYLGAVQKQLRYDKIHALDIANIPFVVTEGYKDTSQFLVAPASSVFLKVRVLRECSTQVSLNLRQSVLIWLHLN